MLICKISSFESCSTATPDVLNDEKHCPLPLKLPPTGFILITGHDFENATLILGTITKLVQNEVKVNKPVFEMFTAHVKLYFAKYVSKKNSHQCTTDFLNNFLL